MVYEKKRAEAAARVKRIQKLAPELLARQFLYDFDRVTVDTGRLLDLLSSDWKGLLKSYIDHVGYSEGVAFLREGEIESSPCFSEEQALTLRAFEQEIAAANATVTT